MWRLINCTLYQKIIKVIKSRTMRSAGHVERMGGMRNSYKILVGKAESRGHSEDPRVDGKIILEWILWKQGEML